MATETGKLKDGAWCLSSGGVFNDECGGGDVVATRASRLQWARCGRRGEMIARDREGQTQAKACGYLRSRALAIRSGGGAKGFAFNALVRQK